MRSALDFRSRWWGILETLPRNYLRVNSQTNLDCDIYRSFHFTERVNFQLRAEFYNIFNQHAFEGMSSSNITSATFGQYNTVSQNSRNGQLAARIIF